MAGFCFKPFDQAQAHLCFGDSDTFCAAHVFCDRDAGYARTKKDYTAVMDCINLARYGESLVGAPFAFSSLDVDEDLSNETDVIGVDPSHIGHFSVKIYRRKVEEIGAEGSSMPSTNLWNAKKVDQLNFKKHGITSSVTLGQNRIPTVGLPVNNQISSKSTILEFKFKYRTFKHKAFERGEAKQQLSDIPADKIIVLDDDGTVQSLARTRSLPSVKRETRVLQEAVKQEVINLGGGEQALERFRMKMKRGLKEEPIELDDFPFASTIRKPSAEKLRIQQETIDVDAIEHTKIKQEVIDADAIADNTIVLEKECTIKYDLTEIDDDAVLTALFPNPAVKDEDSNDINTINEVLPFVEEAGREGFDFYT